jgi:hypothetical protein
MGLLVGCDVVRFHMVPTKKGYKMHMVLPIEIGHAVLVIYHLVVTLGR